VRGALGAGLTVLGAGLVVAVLAGGALEYVNRADYGTFNLSGQPPRIDWCGRRYYPADAPVDLTRAAALQLSEPSPGWTASDFHPVGRTPSGLAFYARLTSGRDRFAGPLLPCAMAVFLEVGQDRFHAYGLSGGP
jgi:hypothetical protein